MNLGLRGNATFLLASSLVLGCGVWSFADDAEPTHQLGLADLAKYREALAGKPTADYTESSNPPARVSFRDLWNRPDKLRGRRVIIEGRVQRIFRQGPVGSFPPLSEIWIASPAGDPFCLIVPQESSTGILPVNDNDRKDHATPERVPKLGQAVRFTGTFLKMIRYAAGDGNRLAPLVVGDQAPVPVRGPARANLAISFSADNVVGRWSGSPISWLVGLMLVLLATGVLARQHLRVPIRRSAAMRPCRKVNSTGPDPPLVFIDPRDDP